MDKEREWEGKRKERKGIEGRKEKKIKEKEKIKVGQFRHFTISIQ
jgi:hypothetical protein